MPITVTIDTLSNWLFKDIPVIIVQDGNRILGRAFVEELNNSDLAATIQKALESHVKS